MLVPADIETFASCPFCNTHLDYSAELEDFILAPIIARWENAANVFKAAQRGEN